MATTLNNYGNTSREVVAERTRRQMERNGALLATGEAVPTAAGGSARPSLPPPAPAKSAAARLRELKGLADEGLITPAEYAAKRSAIVAEI